MGSLMAGWDCPVADPELVKLKRNKSMTKEEIDAFWRLKRQREEEHLRDISLLSPRSQVNALGEAIKRSQETNTSLENLMLQKKGWWIRSNSAFLNEPPVIGGEEGSSKRYASQFHVAHIAAAGAAPKTTTSAAGSGI